MNDNSTSLDRLHDIAVPPPVPWWPPAPGWYVVLALAFLAVILLFVWQWRRWRANAYRRAALRELESAKTPDMISEILRRTALVFTPRATLSGLSGEQWPAWLASQSPEPMSDQVRKQLATAIYRPTKKVTDVNSLRAYAEVWIRKHSPKHRLDRN
ncbi:DUF4381 domain-containing protein [Thalassoroseus pseudoceratinae]|uniref:DUF4381 domain-containing protein n=1 Tax=Thalassoroseus pseudoceratinae TaxID=2713176 RepID=UPI001422F96B|nr:DUF4381 domain-containing protein [Thalassoroseus pseudoceratinae]